MGFSKARVYLFIFYAFALKLSCNNHQTFSLTASCNFFYYKQTLHSYKAINCSIPQMEALLFAVPVWLICRKVCRLWKSKLELLEPPLRRCGTQLSIQCGRHSFHCTHRIFQPRIPRAPFLCGCYYSSLQCGGRDEGLEICYSRKQHHQWVGERNILHRWK